MQNITALSENSCTIIQASFEVVSSKGDVRCIFETEEILRDLDSKLDALVEVRQEIHDFHTEVRESMKL